MVWHTVGLLWRTAWQRPGLVLTAWVGAALTELAVSFAAPAIIAVLFTRLQHGVDGQPISLANTWPLLAAYAALALYGDVIGWRVVIWATWRFEVHGQRVLHAQCLRHLLCLSLDFHHDQFGGALVSQTTKLVSAFEKFWDSLVFMVTRVVVALVASTVILTFLWWPFAVVLALLSAIYLSAVALTSRKLVHRFADEAAASNRLTARLADVVTNVSAVKGYGRETHEQADFDALLGTWQQRALRVMRRYLGLTTVYSTIMSSIKCAAVLGAVVALQTQAVPAGTVYLILTYTLTVCMQLWETNRIVRDMNKALGDAREMTAILHHAPEITDADHLTSLADTANTVDTAGASVAFTQVGFTHLGAAGPLFSGFDLSIPAGQRVGLVGASGSGKSSLVRLLLRFSDLNAGRILLDGVNIARLRQRQLRELIAYVPQEPVLFHRSLRENIAYARPAASEQRVRRAAQMANALEFIDELPEGLDTLVGERGVKLSGGQRQRIVLARAILKDAPLLVLDEASSALDSHSEHLIQRSLQQAMRGRTTLVIAHRLSTIHTLDRILVMDGGRIVEDGTHEQLLAAQGPYASLWQRQSGGFLPVG